MYSEPKKEILYKVYATIFIASEWEKNLEYAHDLYLYYVEVHANEKIIQLQQIDGFHAL